MLHVWLFRGFLSVVIFKFYILGTCVHGKRDRKVKEVILV